MSEYVDYGKVAEILNSIEIFDADAAKWRNYFLSKIEKLDRIKIEKVEKSK